MKIEEVLQTNRFRDEQHKATLNLLYTVYWIRTNLSGALKGYGLTLEQFNVMRILKGKYPEQLCVKDIAGRLIEKSSNVPRILDKLIIKKLVKKGVSKSDKRETLVSLTEKGIKLLEEVNASVLKVYEDTIGLNGMANEADAKMLNELLEKIRRTEQAPL